jgi:methylmalonyl-CoA mutase N-terminal domain/subunit
MVEAVKQNFPQREIADASWELQSEIDDGKRKIVGVNSYTEGSDGQLPILRIDPGIERKQIGRVEAVRAKRDGAAVERSLVALKEQAAGTGNLMPALMQCARAHATEGEIVTALQDVWGSYSEVPVF